MRSPETPSARGMFRARRAASATFVALLLVNLPAAAQAAGGPSLLLSPASAGAGASVKVAGTGFAARARTTVLLRSTLVATTKTNGQGNFSATFRVPAVAAGAATVTAMAGATSATASFTVVSPTTTTTAAPTTTTTVAPATTTTVAPSTTTTTTAATLPQAAPSGPAPTPGPRPMACTGTQVSPGSDIQRVIDAGGANATFCFAPGVYRLSRNLVPRPGQTFVGSVGTVLNGSKLLTNWSREGSWWYVGGQTQESWARGECITGYTGCTRGEEVYLDNRPLWQVTSPAELAPGRFYLDYAADRIYLADDPTGRSVETTVAEYAFAGKYASWDEDADNVTVRNFVIEKFGTPAQYGAVAAFQSRGWVVEDNEVRLNHAVGITVNSGARVRRNFVHDNGQLGIGASSMEGYVAGPSNNTYAVDVVVEGNEVARNNTAGFSDWWEAGGMKFAVTDGVVARGNHVHHNHGPGIWADIDNIRGLYEHNVITDNDNAGIFYEISYSATMRYNRISRNGHVNRPPWAYGAGIQVAHSSDVEVYGNVVEDNLNGITVILQERGSGEYGEWKPRNVTVRDNDVSMRQGFTGAVQDTGDNTLFSTRGIRFHGNDYVVPPQGRQWAWANSVRSWEEWRAYGNDTTGTVTYR